jgi:hypothetical protein
MGRRVGGTKPLAVPPFLQKTLRSPIVILPYGLALVIAGVFP